MEQITDESKSRRPGVAAVNVIAVGAVGGLLVGMLTAPMQGWLPESVRSLSNSAGPWSVVAFFLALRASTTLVGATTASITLACCEIGYVISSTIRGDANSRATTIFWLVAACAAGPLLGIAATWASQQHLVRRGACYGVLFGVLFGEGLYGLNRLSETTDSRFWAAEVAIAAVGLAIVILRNRSLAMTGSLMAMTTAAASVVFLAAVSV